MFDIYILHSKGTVYFRIVDRIDAQCILPIVPILLLIDYRHKVL